MVPKISGVNYERRAYRGSAGQHLAERDAGTLPEAWDNFAISEFDRKYCRWDKNKQILRKNFQTIFIFRKKRGLRFA